MPKIQPFSFGTDPFYLGDSTTIQCGISTGDLPLNFFWYLNKRPVSDIPGVKVGLFGKKTSVLSIDSLTENHAGNYTCLVQNPVGNSSHDAKLSVKGTTFILLSIYFLDFNFTKFSLLVPPRISPFSFENNPMQAGQYVQVTCLVAEGDLPLEITWTLNDQSLESFPEVSIAKLGKRSSVLTIESITYTNAGNYTCEATNIAGRSVQIAQLQVNGY